jgi:hypothetical protein
MSLRRYRHDRNKTIHLKKIVEMSEENYNVSLRCFIHRDLIVHSSSMIMEKLIFQIVTIDLSVVDTLVRLLTRIFSIDWNTRMYIINNDDANQCGS